MTCILEKQSDLRFFGREDIPELFAEDQIAALNAYFMGVRYPLLRENRMDAEPIISDWRQ